MNAAAAESAAAGGNMAPVTIYCRPEASEACMLAARYPIHHSIACCLSINFHFGPIPSPPPTQLDSYVSPPLTVRAGGYHRGRVCLCRHGRFMDRVIFQNVCVCVSCLTYRYCYLLLLLLLYGGSCVIVPRQQCWNDAAAGEYTKIVKRSITDGQGDRGNLRKEGRGLQICRFSLICIPICV